MCAEIAELFGAASELGQKNINFFPCVTDCEMSGSKGNTFSRVGLMKFPWTSRVTSLREENIYK